MAENENPGTSENLAESHGIPAIIAERWAREYGEGDVHMAPAELTAMCLDELARKAGELATAVREGDRGEHRSVVTRLSSESLDLLAEHYDLVYWLNGLVGFINEESERQIREMRENTRRARADREHQADNENGGSE